MVSILSNKSFSPIISFTSFPKIICHRCGRLIYLYQHQNKKPHKHKLIHKTKTPTGIETAIANISLGLNPLNIVGDFVGDNVLLVGEKVGEKVGSRVGVVGDCVGLFVGVFVGVLVGPFVGNCVGDFVGINVGDCVGGNVGILQIANFKILVLV